MLAIDLFGWWKINSGVGFLKKSFHVVEWSHICVVLVDGRYFVVVELWFDRLRDFELLFWVVDQAK